MKIKKGYKIPILVSSALLTIVGVFAFIIFSSNPSPALSWFNSSWFYKRGVTITNPGSSLTNEDVLVIYDTASLVSAGKLQSNCNDIRFVDSDDSTALTYWIEAGCNTSTTYMWVRVPSVPNGNKTIYLYYGNTSAANGQASWTGKFYFLKESACDTGWTTESNTGGAFYQKFPKGSSSFGTTSGLTTHTHSGGTVTTSTNSADITTVRSQAQTNIADEHTHQITLSMQEENHLPPYMDMIFCSNTSIYVKQNLIALFDATVPTGFTRVTTLDNLFIRGNSSYTGTSAGSTQHSHSINTSTTGGPSATSVCSTGTAVTMASSTHTHDTGSSTSGTSSHISEYLTTIYGKANGDGYAPSSIIVMSNAVPPLGWTRITALDAKYPYGGSSYGTTGGNATHTHSISLSFAATTGTATCATGTPNHNKPNNLHTHSITGNLNNHSNDPPYVETIFVKKNVSLSNSVGTEEHNNSAPTEPTGLLTEGATNPTGIKTGSPKFSALYNDPNSTDTSSYYQIQVNTASNFSGTTMWDSTKSLMTTTNQGQRSPDITYNGSALTLNTGVTYYWRIKFWDNYPGYSLEGVWSATASFKMNEPPIAPTALLTEGATNPTGIKTGSPKFSALYNDNDTTDTSGYYQIQVNTNSSFTGTVMWDSTKSLMTTTNQGQRSPDITYNGSALTLNTGVIYYWRIKFWDNGDAEGAWSATANFRMNQPPTAPTSLLTQGASNPTGIRTATPYFSAIYNDNDTTDTSSNYQIQVNTASNFGGTTMWDSGKASMTTTNQGLRSPNITYNGSPIPLNTGTTYYWRIKFWDNGDAEGAWSATGTFRMNQPPLAPTALLTDGVTNPPAISNNTPIFSAIYNDGDTSDFANFYQLEVNTASDFTGTVMWNSGKTAMTNTNHGQRSPDITYNGSAISMMFVTYHWRIKFWDDAGAEGVWSETANFTTSPPRMFIDGLRLDGIRLN